MADGGWIKLYRNIREHWIWEDPVKLKWWLDILLQANHQDKTINLGNELLEIKRGSFHTSELKLCDRWSVSKTTVRRFLNLLENDSMIVLKKSKKGTTLEVCNYNDYQGISEDEKTINKPQKNHEVYHKSTIEEPYGIPQKNHMVYTNKNEKKDKNDKEGKEREEEPPILEPLSNLSQFEEVFLKQYGETSYRTWLEPCEVKDTVKEVLIVAPSDFTKSILESRYKDGMELLCKKKIEIKGSA